MNLIVVTNANGNAHPYRNTVLLHNTEHHVETNEPDKRLQTEANDLPENAPKMALTNAELVDNDTDTNAPQPHNDFEGELNTIGSPLRVREPLDDRSLEDNNRTYRIANNTEPIAKAPHRDLTPKILERDNAIDERDGRNAEHHLVRAQPKARDHRAQPLPDDLPMHRPPNAKRVNVEPIRHQHADPNDDLDLDSQERNAKNIAIALAHEENGHRDRDFLAEQDATRVNGAREHDQHSTSTHGSRNTQTALVHFFQSKYVHEN